MNSLGLSDNTKTAIQNTSVLLASFLVGAYIGRRFSNIGFKLGNLINYGTTKLVLVVREDLKLGKGKLAAQCCHATIMAYKKASVKQPGILSAWELIGQPKVVVKARDLEHLHELEKTGTSLGLVTAMVRDAGRTQVPSGTPTVVAIGPGRVDIVDKVTGELKLI